MVAWSFDGTSHSSWELQKLPVRQRRRGGKEGEQFGGYHEAMGKLRHGKTPCFE